MCGQAIGGKLRAGDVAQLRVGDAGARVDVHLDILLFGEHAHAVFGQLALQPAIGGVEKRHQ